MNSIMTSIFSLVTCLFPPFFPSSSPTWSELVFFFQWIFICLLSTCNVSLHCIHTKSSKYYIHLQQKKNCTNFANVYNIYQFLCVYNITLHCKCNVYFYIYIYIYIKRVNRKSYSNFVTVVMVCLTFWPFFFFFGLSFVPFFSFYIYYYTDTTNFTIFSQLLRYQFLISQNKIIKYETVINHN